MRSSRRYQSVLRGLTAAISIVTMTLAVTTAAIAGKTAPPPPPVCGANPNPAMNGSVYTLVGLYFTAGMGVTVYVYDSVATWTYQGTVASNGTFSIPAMANFSSTGTKNVRVNKTGDRKMVTYCQGSFTAL
jgi:hypothetical protein